MNSKNSKTLPIYLYNHPILRRECNDVNINNEETFDLVKDIKRTLKEVNSGIGLSAPQVGYDKAIFVIDMPEFKEVFINPVITYESKNKVKQKEGCLSFPGLEVPVARPTNIEVEYYNETKELKTLNLEGMNARVVQHEMDHLEGVLIIDHVNPKYRNILKPKIKNIIDNKVVTNYEVKTKK